MNAFLCALRLDGTAIRKRELFAAIARLPRDREYQGCAEGAFSAMAVVCEPPSRPLLGRFRNIVGVGDVRLANRSELALLAGQARGSFSDLELVLAAIDATGPEIVPRLRGSFCFVAWDSNAQKLIGARDPYGSEPLFYRRTAEHLLLSSQSEPLCGEERPVQPGSVLVQRGSVTAQQNYWGGVIRQPARRQLSGR